MALTKQLALHRITNMPSIDFRAAGALLSAVLVVCLLEYTEGCASKGAENAGGHQAEGAFMNPEIGRGKSFIDFLRWRWDRLWKDIPEPYSYDFEPAENDPAFLRENREKTTVTWIGHATVLLQVNGRNILTDPHFSRRASPVQWAGPERVLPPGLTLAELPPIDMVVLSHDHYDSLDEASITALRARPGGENTAFFVPLGLAGWFRQRGIENVIELDWWESAEHEGLKATAVPARHWSKRSPFFSNNTLWAGWAVSSGGFNFLFVGDSGYSTEFAKIGEKLGPFHLAAIPIGAYEPRWFMKDYHMNPEEAAQVHLDLKAEKSIAIHWGTFALTDEPLDEPPVRLREALREKDIPEKDFMVLRHGETVVLGNDPE